MKKILNLTLSTVLALGIYATFTNVQDNNQDQIQQQGTAEAYGVLYDTGIQAIESGVNHTIVLDNNGDYGNLKKVDGIENLTIEGEYTLHLQSMGLPSLLGGYDNHDVNSGLSMLELQLCTVWMDQLKSTVGYNVIDSTYPLSIVPKHPLLLPMQLIKFFTKVKIRKLIT